MPPYLRLGSVPPKRHIAHRREPGFRDEGLYYEEVVTSGGFGRAYSILYHLRPPTRVRNVEPAGTVEPEVVTPPVLRHHHLKSGGIARSGGPISGRIPPLLNDYVVIPRCTTYRLELDPGEPADLLVFESTGNVTIPPRYVNADGQIRLGAP